MTRCAAVALVAVLTGCSQNVAPVAANLEPPNPRLMVPPPVLPDVAPGAELFASNGQCSAEYVRETGKLVGLQRWSARVTRK